MTIDTVAQALHHKSVLGGVLTPEEQERLRHWYAEMDAHEAAMFARAREGPHADLEALKTEIEKTNAKLVRCPS